jgi:hypothetical protein
MPMCADARRQAPCQQVCEPIMTKPSERIVVFVTPAQKRAIAATADELRISVSELMRRAVLSFSATSEQVKAASIVDRLNVPRAPDALDAALQRVAHDAALARAALPPALQTRVGIRAGSDATGAGMAGGRSTASAATTPVESVPPASEPVPLLPADVLAALTTEVDEDAVATAQAVARMAAARAAASENLLPAAVTVQTHVKSVLKRPRLDPVHDEDDPQSDLGPEGSRFA